MHSESQRVKCRVALIEWQALLATECTLLNADTDRTRETLMMYLCMFCDDAFGVGAA